MTDLKPGDRVRVYLSLPPEAIVVRNATVELPGTRVTPKGHRCVYVCVDEPVPLHSGGEALGLWFWINVKQVRRLRKRERRRVYCLAHRATGVVSVESGVFKHPTAAHANCPEGHEVVEFRETKEGEVRDG